MKNALILLFKNRPINLFTLFLITVFVFSFCQKINAQTNYTLEWESSSALGFWYGTAFMNSNSNTPQLVFAEYDYSVYRLIDGASKSLVATFNSPGDSSSFQFPYKPNYNLYQPVDVNNDGIYEVLNILDPYYTGGTEYAVRIMNGANGNILHTFSYQVSPESFNYVYTFDVDGDGFVEILIWTNGTLKIYSTTSSVNILNTSEIISDFNLGQNYPNPFNPSTNIEYSIGSNSEVQLLIHDLTGRELRKMNFGIQSAGNYTVRFSDLNLASGTYFYSLVVDNKPLTKKMVKLK